MIKKFLILIIEGSLYGLFGGAVLWTSLYLIYETDISIARSKLVGQISMSFLSFPLNFVGLCLGFAILASLVRLIIGVFFEKYHQVITSWLVAGLISVSLINLIILEGPVPLIPGYFGYGWLCCIDNSSGYLLWPITFLLIVLYTFLFVTVKRFIQLKLAQAGIIISETTNQQEKLQ